MIGLIVTFLVFLYIERLYQTLSDKLSRLQDPRYKISAASNVACLSTTFIRFTSKVFSLKELFATVAPSLWLHMTFSVGTRTLVYLMWVI